MSADPPGPVWSGGYPSEYYRPPQPVARATQHAAALRAPSAPGFWTSRSPASRAYLAPMLLLLAVVVGLVVYEFLRAPLPPGVDPGHWLAASYAYVGLPTAPDPANTPFFYSPLIFPFLGLLVLATGSPPAAATILAALLLLGYGLTVIHLARRYLAFGMFQVALVGLALFCGTTLQMLFWGAYPNYLGFILMNEAFVFLLLFVRERRTRDGALFYLFAALTFLGHDLTFYMLVASVAGAVLFLLLFRRVAWRFLLDLRNIVGILAVGILVYGYGKITAAFGIPHPSYFYSNPAAFHIDQLGEIFAPLGHYPAFFPAGAAVYLSNGEALAILFGVPILILLVLAVGRLRAPERVTARVLIAAGWLSAVLAIPALGDLAHVDTDYTRFLYFLPLPSLLFALVGLEQWIGRRLLAPRPAPAPEGPLAPWQRPRPRRDGRLAAGATVAIGLGLLFVSVTLPVLQAGEASGASTGHDAAFVSAAQWLHDAPGNGSVLTTSTVARWTEALSDRQAFTVGPVWLLFDPFQIQNAEGAYWALSCSTAITSGSAVLSYSGANSSMFGEDPQYTSYLYSVPFPAFRIAGSGLSLNATVGGVAGSYPAQASGQPRWSLAGTASAPIGVLTFSGPVATIVELGSVGPGSAATIAFEVDPHPGVRVQSLSVTLARPPGDSAELSRDSLVGLNFSGNSLAWSVRGSLGQSPNPASVTTSVTFSEPPVAQGSGSFAPGGAWRGIFPDANGSGPFALELAIASPGASNEPGALPALFSTAGFLSANRVDFLLWPNGRYNADELTYFETSFGFRSVYSNVEWVILER